MEGNPKQPLTNGGQENVPMDDYGTIEKGGEKPGAMRGQEPPRDPVLDSACFFKDGKTRTDFIIVYEETAEGLEQQAELKEVSLEEDTELKRSSKEKTLIYRNRYLKHLTDSGLLFEEEQISGESKTGVFVKISASWDTLCTFAEELNIRVPLEPPFELDPELDKPRDADDLNWSAKVLRRFAIPNVMRIDVPNPPPDYYTAPFKKDKLSRYLGSDKQETFFKTTQRQSIVWEILQTTAYGRKKKAEIGIERLVDEDVFTAAYPPHDGPDDVDPSTPPDQYNDRQVLRRYWARWGVWYKYQPLQHIREYMGEKIAIYFAWLGFYTAWLLPSAFVGFLVFMYGALTVSSAPYQHQICNSNETYLMCPLYDSASTWYISTGCMYSKLGYVCDNTATVFFAVFVSLWAVFKLEFWKRTNASLAHQWDVMDYEEEEERPRPQYSAMAPEFARNPVTGQMEPHFPEQKRIPRIASGVFVVIMMVVVVLIFIVAVIIYRTLVSSLMYSESGWLETYATIIGSMTAAIINLIIIMILSVVYQSLAFKMTYWEMHRTQTEFEDSYTVKVFIFQFINYYSAVIYIAFIKGKFVGYPGHYTRIFGIRMEECQPGGCLAELAIQLAVVMIGKQMINNCQELIVPRLKKFLYERTKAVGRKGSDYQEKPRYEDEYVLAENEGLFEEYLEMAIQFGFITIFVAAFPLAPLFALLNNWMEIRLDAQKFVCETRRPVAERAQDIGTWFTILDVLAQLAVISNAFLIAFTSDFLPELLYKYWYRSDMAGYLNFTVVLATKEMSGYHADCYYQDWRDRNGNHTMFFYQLVGVKLGFVIVFEHVVFFIQRMIDIMVPDVPESLQTKIRREQYLAKQALTDAVNKAETVAT